MLLGFLAAAIFGLNATRQQANPNVAYELSAVDVWDHILSRAKEYPEVFMHANMLPLMGMILMLQDAEAKADSDLYLSAMRLLWPVFCASHRTGYVFIIARFYVWWWCASTKAKKICTHLMFRVTKNGSNIFPGRWVEHGVRFMRMMTGGKKVQGAVKTFVSTVRQMSLLLVHRLRIKSEIQGDTHDFADTEHGRKALQLDKVSLNHFYISTISIFSESDRPDTYQQNRTRTESRWTAVHGRQSVETLLISEIQQAHI